MKWLIIPAFWLLYWGICFLCTGTDKKTLSGLRSYPDAVQSIVRDRLCDAPKEKSIPAILLGNLILFTVVFSALGLGFKNVLAFDGYLSAFCYFLILGEGLGLFDLILGCGVFNIAVFGNFVPLFTNIEAYFSTRQSFGEEYVSTLAGIFANTWLIPVMIASCMVCGWIGGLLGKALLKKHFEKAGIA